MNVTRLGNGWASVSDPKTGELIVLHLDSMRQETTDPLESSAIISTFSFYRRAALREDEVLKPTNDDLKKATRYPNEVVLLMGFTDGLNPARLFDQVVYVLFNVILGNHPPMTYQEYVDYAKINPRYGKTYLALPNAASPTGRFAVWKVTFTRTFGVDDNGVYNLLSSKAKYRFGYMGGVEIFPGSIYNFPSNFMLERDVEGGDFIAVLANLLEAASLSDDVAKVEPYWVK